MVPVAFSLLLQLTRHLILWVLSQVCEDASTHLCIRARTEGRWQGMRSPGLWHLMPTVAWSVPAEPEVSSMGQCWLQQGGDPCTAQGVSLGQGRIHGAGWASNFQAWGRG